MTGPRPGAPARIVLQTIAAPDPDICTEGALFARFGGAAHPSLSTGRIDLGPGGRVDLGTYFNLLNLGTWMRHCALDGLDLTLRGAGRVWLSIELDVPKGATGAVLHQEIVELTEGGARVDLAHALPLCAAAGGAGIVTAHLRAVTPARLDGGSFGTRAPATAAPPRLAISITTFRREDAARRTAERIAAFLDDPARSGTLGARARVTLVDNGRTLPDPGLPRTRVIANPNLGGAGGFARGLAAAIDDGCTHCLFMDDDASFQMESLVRTDAFLTLARDAAAALAGAMISSARPWTMWENGSVFDRACRPLHMGTDLRRRSRAVRMELAASRAKPRGFYGGWWFFAFPLAAARRWPFPFFVRGDDISFSLANDFRTATLNGVVSFQDDFAAKESPTTLYLDMRNHLHHHLVQDGLEIGWRGTARIPLRFVARSLARFHYESAEAQLLAWEDVMRGPGFFAANADMTERRATLAAMTRAERMAPLPAPPPPDWHRPGLGGWRLRAMLYTINGHLMPFFRLRAGAASVPIADRGMMHAAWGHDSITYLGPSRETGYTVAMDRRRFFGIVRRALGLAARWRRDYPALMAAHRAAYPAMTDRPFWQARFAEAPAAPGPAP